MKIREEIKWMIYCVGLGVALISYAHTNFATAKKVNQIEKELKEIQIDIAKKHDIQKVEEKIDKLLFRLIGEK